jgi:hypothetical protein
MIELSLRIVTNGGEKGPLVFDNLVFTTNAFWKIDQFRESTGEKLIPGQQVVFNADDCLDRKGHVILTVDTYQGRSRNKVAEYIVPPKSATQSSPATTKQVTKPAPDGEPADIPF